MTQKVSRVKARCQAGWSLFFRIGDLYTSITNLAPEYRDWTKHADAVEEHKNHVESCGFCRKGLKEIQMTLEEMAVADGDGISQIYLYWAFPGLCLDNRERIPGNNYLHECFKIEPSAKTI